jgi:hypothetical protein
LTYSAEVSADLAVWTPTSIPVGTPVTNPDGTLTVTYRDADLIGSSSHRFIRGKVLQP